MQRLILKSKENAFFSLDKGDVIMTYTIHTSIHSIEECKRAVEELHKKGYKKEQITLVTNNAYQDAILENWDLRGSDGAIFSSHSLLEKVNNLFNLKQYEAFQKKTGTFPDGMDFLADRIAAIENGSIVIITKEADE